MTVSQEKQKSRVAGTIAVVLARVIVPLWLFIGAVLKLADLSPTHLPAAIIKWAGEGGLDLMFVLRFSIAAELIVVGVMVLVPPLARWTGIVVLASFIPVLVGDLALGASSCGCFGAVADQPVDHFGDGCHIFPRIGGARSTGTEACSDRESPDLESSRRGSVGSGRGGPRLRSAGAGAARVCRGGRRCDCRDRGGPAGRRLLPARLPVLAGPALFRAGHRPVGPRSARRYRKWFTIRDFLPQGLRALPRADGAVFQRVRCHDRPRRSRCRSGPGSRPRTCCPFLVGSAGWPSCRRGSIGSSRRRFWSDCSRALSSAFRKSIPKRRSASSSDGAGLFEGACSGECVIVSPCSLEKTRNTENLRLNGGG